MYVILNVEVLRADEGEARRVWSSAAMQGPAETEDPRETPLTSSIVRHDSYITKSGGEPSGNRTRFALNGGEYKKMPPPPPRRSGFNSCSAHSGFSQVGVMPDDDTGRRVFSGISRIHLSLHSGRAPYTLLASSSSAFKSSILGANTVRSRFCMPTCSMAGRAATRMLPACCWLLASASTSRRAALETRSLAAPLTPAGIDSCLFTVQSPPSASLNHHQHPPVPCSRLSQPFPSARHHTDGGYSSALGLLSRCQYRENVLVSKLYRVSRKCSIDPFLFVISSNFSEALFKVSEEIWEALNIKVLRADEGEVSSPGMKGRSKREIRKKTRRPAASSGTIPTCENPEWTGRELKPVRLGKRRAV
ncbi:hypothetical protein PR048_000586 [Dryococelus australis]|uniref:Uncharacterized protein n=1 Tax=Dryococelus australis TaxID=614101 RepID=A0ABQ9IF66_9NEOP|nr:hypothetical protein PR048_000586 [Dryococelus australis]